MRDPHIESELRRLVDIAKAEIPLLSRVTVFGSYNKGGWDPEKSDVDVMIEVEDGIKIYPCSSSGTLGYINRTLRIATLTEALDPRIDYAIFNKPTIKYIWNRDEGKGSLGKNMSEGRLLYPTNLPAIIN